MNRKVLFVGDHYSQPEQLEMDEYQSDKNIKKESAMDTSNAGARIADASSILDVSQTIQQLLAMSSIAGSAILSPMQLLSASASSGASTSQLSLPWIMPHHYQQMMVLQQGLSGQPFLMSDVIDDNKDGHVVVMPTIDQGNQYNNVSAVSSPADASTAQQNVSDSASRLLNYHLAAAQKPAAKENVTAAQMVAAGGGAQKGAPVRHGQTQVDTAKMPRPRPPKKPLTPYMLFSKEVRCSYIHCNYRKCNCKCQFIWSHSEETHQRRSQPDNTKSRSKKSFQVIVKKRQSSYRRLLGNLF